MSGLAIARNDCEIRLAFRDLQRIIGWAVLCEVNVPKVNHLAGEFKKWIENYDHRDDAHSVSFRDFISCDSEIDQCGTTYEEYVALAFKLNREGFNIEWIVSPEKYFALIEEARSRNAG